MRNVILYILPAFLLCCNNNPQKLTPYPISKSKYDSLIYLANLAKLGREMVKAEKIMNDIVECDSENSAYLTERALILLPEKVEKAMKDVNKAIGNNLNYSKAYYVKAMTWGIIGNPDSSLFYYSKAIEMEPKNTDYLEARGLVYSANGKNEEALKDFDFAVTLDSNKPILYGYRGKCKINLKDYASALEDFNRMLFYVKDDETLYYNISFVLFKLGKYSECLDAANKGIELNPNEPKLYVSRGSAKSKLKDKDGACEDFKFAAKLGDEEAIRYCKQCDEYYKTKQVN